MIEGIQETYIERLKHFSELLKMTERKIKWVSYSRLTIALTGILTFYLSITESTDFFYLLLLLSISFAFFAVLHSRLFRKKEWIQNALVINKEELKYLNQNYSFYETGNEFINFNHPYAFDLDVFGKDSLYQSITRAVTHQGKIMLADALSAPTLTGKEIISRQECIKELKDKIDFRQNFQATGLLLNESPSDREKLKQWLKENYNFIHQKSIPYLLLLIPIVNILFISLSIVQGETHTGLYISILASWLCYGLYGKKINHLYSLVSKKRLLLENYSELLKLAHNEKALTPELEALRTSLLDASGQLQKLASYVGWFDQRLNILISPVLNTLFLFDLIWCYKIEKWRQRNDEHLLQWLDALGKLDVLCSLANFSYNNPSFTFPHMDSNGLSVSAKEMAHPLIKSSKRVYNDFSLGDPTYTAIITGANMAGKSTFLRTLGVNIILAHAGAPVCASYFKCTILQLISSMRISDSLKDDVSYFYAELQRLKSIKENVSKGNPTLILLDEMLRGTNSKDKQLGSKAFVENLLQHQCLVLVATHDLLLGQLEEEYPSKVKNFCFESFLNNNELIFDYRIRNGVAKNTNASFLMKNLGII